jgi:RimJ/RimL family protein N-acetyltransferase
MKRIVNDSERIGRFVAARLGLGSSFCNFTALGLEENGQLIAGVVYTEFNGSNVFMHVAAVPGKRWMTRQYLWACFHYPFKVMRVRRITGWVEESNGEARRFDEHLGFEEEARLSEAARDGGAVIVYRMTPEKCRFIGAAYAPLP